MTDAAGSERVRLMLARIVAPPIIRKTALLYDREKMLRSYHDHAELLAALKGRDPLWAEAVMTMHIRRALSAYREDMTEDLVVPH